MNRYNYYSEKKALQADFRASLYQSGNIFLKIYLKYGFSKLCQLFKLKYPWQRKVLFDFLVFEKKAVFMCIKENKSFFLQLIGNGQGSVMRHILGIQFSKYDKVWEECLEFLNQLYTQKMITDKLFHLASESFFHTDKKLRKKGSLN